MVIKELKTILLGTMPNVRGCIRTAILSTPIWLLLRFWTHWVVVPLVRWFAPLSGSFEAPAPATTVATLEMT